MRYKLTIVTIAVGLLAGCGGSGNTQDNAALCANLQEKLDAQTTMMNDPKTAKEAVANLRDNAIPSTERDMEDAGCR
jgi:hypothetical protein